MRSKIIEIDMIRAFAIAAVLLIHVTASAVVGLPTSSISQALYLAVNKLSGFAVPLFILLSGMVLFYSYYDRWDRRSFRIFYIKRLKFVVIPYVMITLFYYEFNSLLATRHLQLDFTRLAKLLLWGEASYHLYFIVIIVQFYVLFPLLIGLVKKFKHFTEILVIAGVGIQLLFYAYNLWVAPLPHKPSLCVTYFSFFCIGGYIGIHYDAFCLWLRKHIYWIFPCFVASGLFYAMLFQLAQRGYSYRNAWYDLYFNLYPYFTLFVLVWLLRLLPTGTWFARFLLSLGAASFGIYLLHPAFLSIYHKFVPGVSKMALYHLSLAGAFIFILAASWVLTAWLRRLRFSWMLIGK